MHSNLQSQPALMRAVKKLSGLGADQYELYFQHRTSTKIEAKDGQVDTLTRSEDVGLAIRVLKEAKLGFSFTTALSDEALDKAVDSAIEIANFMPPDSNHGFHSFGSVVYPDVDSTDQKGLKSPLSQKIDLALQLESECRKADSRVKGVRSASITENFTRTHLVDSSGEHIQHESSMYSASVTCKAESGGDAQMGHDFGFSNFLDALDVSRVAKNAAEFATELLGAKSPKTMQCPAILRNSVVAELIEFLSASFSAEEIDKGRSMLANKKGERVFSELVHLIDDGLMPGGYGTSPFDGEGVPSQKTVLVDGGFIQNFLYDTYTARKFKTEPTGSASRGIKSPPSIAPSNLYLPAGKKSHQDLMSGIVTGILITDLMGVHTANPVTGDFSVGASGILIEKGKLTTPVRGFAVAGNVLGLFRRIVDVGSDLRFFGSVGAPSVRISELSVGGS